MSSVNVLYFDEILVADKMLKFGGGHIFLCGFMLVTRKSANPYIRRWLGLISNALGLGRCRLH